MTLASDIITAAFREGNLIPIGTTPTTAEVTEALAYLNRRLKIVFGVEMGEPLTDWMVPQPQRTAAVAANYPQCPLANDMTSSTWAYPPKNSRIIFGGVTNTVYFPESPDDGSRMAVVQGSGAGDSGAVGQILTLNGNGRTIEAANTKTFTFASPAATSKQWFYRADLGDWLLVATLVAGDTFPFPADFDDYWICGLNIRIAGPLGKPVSDATKEAYLRAERAFKVRYRQSAPTVYGSDNIPLSQQSYTTGTWF